MASFVLIDELLVAVHVPAGLPAAQGRAVRRTLKRSRFTIALSRAIREVFCRYPSLSRVRITLSR